MSKSRVSSEKVIKKWRRKLEISDENTKKKTPHPYIPCPQKRKILMHTYISCKQFAVGIAKFIMGNVVIYEPVGSVAHKQWQEQE